MVCCIFTKGCVSRTMCAHACGGASKYSGPCSCLSAQGIIHRDLKVRTARIHCGHAWLTRLTLQPENVLLADEHDDCYAKLCGELQQRAALCCSRVA